MNIIFVCTGNTCRSPMAEYYLKSKNLTDVSVISRGFSAGEPANEKSVAVMLEKGIDLKNHISKSITPDEIKSADKIICMTEQHRQMLILFGASPDNVYVLNGGISDPFGLSVETYRKCRDDIFSGIDALIEQGFFSDITVTRAQACDCAVIADIERQSFSDPWSEKSITESLNAGTEFYIARINHTFAGYMGISKIAGEGYVTNVAVLPPFRRKGIGETLLRYVISGSMSELEFISLEVRVSNEAAVSLYKKLGFETVGMRKRFYTNPVEDALIMTKRFNSDTE